MASAEENGLEEDRPCGAAGDGLKLLLKVAAKSEFLTKPNGESKRNPREALENYLGKKSLRGIGSTAEDVRIHQAHPNGPERCAQSEVFDHVGRGGPSAANKIPQTPAALLHSRADKEHQQPFKDEYRNVTRHGAAGRRGCLGGAA
jgi:hypothetical protein